MSSPQISVAMATYNGEEFIQEQLLSILQQTKHPAELVIRDDGSTDRTVDIVREFSQNAPFPVNLMQNAERLGYGENFLSAASLCKFGWIAFCDQDDVWLPHKLERVSEAIREASNDTVLIIHQGEIVNSDLSPTGNSLPYFPQTSLVPRRGHSCSWLYLGLGQVIKASLIFELDWQSRPFGFYDHSAKLSHDAWTSRIANALGSTVAIPENCILYRRHSANASVRPLEKRTFFSMQKKFWSTDTEQFGLIASGSAAFHKYLLDLVATSPSQYEASLLQSAGDYDMYARIFSNRQIIHSEMTWPTKFKSLKSNIQLSAYRRGQPYSTSSRQFMQDLHGLSPV